MPDDDVELAADDLLAACHRASSEIEAALRAELHHLLDRRGGLVGVDGETYVDAEILSAVLRSVTDVARERLASELLPRLTGTAVERGLRETFAQEVSLFPRWRVLH